jgi:MoaA/NifB/PqqE/SkfB family radical SAM enzyme
MAERSHTLKRYSEFFGFAFDTFLLRRKRPYLFVLLINDKCNLDCYYCSLKNSGVYDLDAATVRSSLVTAYSRGSRALVVTGGEPMIWQDEGNRIQDIITLAKRIGFCYTAMFTNGTRPLDIPGITFIVTIDGTRESHNSIRKNSYDLVLSNVKDAKSPVIASITLLKSNANLLEESVRQDE